LFAVLRAQITRARHEQRQCFARQWLLATGRSPRASIRSRLFRPFLSVTTDIQPIQRKRIAAITAASVTIVLVAAYLFAIRVLEAVGTNLDAFRHL
jgi:hypothetical protein